MKQILQSLSDGETILAEIPVPSLRDGEALVRTTRSLVSSGTERMLIEFGKAGWIEKARSQPEKVRQVLDKVKTDGLFQTLEAVRAKLDQPIPLGYCNVGVVVESRIPGIEPGTRVASNGHHAEFVSIPKNLLAVIPDEVNDDSAAFTVMGAIALQGVRLASPTLGERVVVVGLGLLGQLSVQILLANGCRVLGMDPDRTRCMLAASFGAETLHLDETSDAVAFAESWSGGVGVDAVLITASTKSSEPLRNAVKMCRKRGRVVLVGVTGMELDRTELFKREVTVQVSCSYGPGRYDQAYEQAGHDYPVGYVRWTEQRNFEAVLELMRDGKLETDKLVSAHFPIERGLDAYRALNEGSSLGLLIDYPADSNLECGGLTPLCGARLDARSNCPHQGAGQQSGVKPPHSKASTVVIGWIGSGNFASRVLAPAFAATGCRLKTVVSAKGVSATHLGRKVGFENAGTREGDVFEDNEINVVVICTPHDSHGRLVLEALRRGKHVFVEKPLCLSEEELVAIESEIKRQNEAGVRLQVMVGFNRRFAPLFLKMKAVTDLMREPKAMIYTVNAGAVPLEHWTQDPVRGGGRIRGEACHFLDLLRHLAGSPVKNANFVFASDTAKTRGDVVSISLSFEDGSIGTVHYIASGAKSFEKERLEVFCGGKVLQLSNFRKLKGFGWSGFSAERRWRQDKGHAEEVRRFVDALREGGPCPIPFEEAAEITRVTFLDHERG